MPTAPSAVAVVRGLDSLLKTPTVLQQEAGKTLQSAIVLARPVNSKSRPPEAMRRLIIVPNAD